MKNKSFKNNKVIISAIGCCAFLSLFLAFNIRSHANPVSTNAISIPKTATNPKTSFITLKDKNAVFGLRIYPKVSTTNNVAARLKSGTKVIAYSETVVNEKITWVKVKANSKVGWVNKKCLTEKYIDIRDNYWRYSSKESNVTISKVKRYKSDVYIANIKINDAKQFKHVYANNSLNGTVKTVVDMTKNYNPIIAINATGFYRNNNNLPMGTVGSKGQIDYFNNARHSIAMGYNGRLNIITKNSTRATYMACKPFWIASFGPILVNNYKMTQTEKGNANVPPAPRVAIGQKSNANEFIIIVVDGRTTTSPGVNFYQMATLFKEKGARVAYNLDGGGSATLTFNGKIINKPSDATGPRKVIDSLFIRDIR